MLRDERVLDYIKKNKIEDLSGHRVSNFLLLSNKGYRLTNNIRNNKLYVSILDESGKAIECYNTKYKDIDSLVEKQKNSIDTLIAISESENYVPGEDNIDGEGDEEIITEDEGSPKYSSIPSGLDAVKISSSPSPSILSSPGT